MKRPQILVSEWRGRFRDTAFEQKVELRGVDTDNLCIVVPTVIRSGPKSDIGRVGHLRLTAKEARALANELNLKAAELIAEINEATSE